MNARQLPLRLLTLIIGIYTLSFGIAMSVVSNLGTTPLSTLPLTYNAIVAGVSIGTFTILFNLLFLILQFLVLKSNFRPVQWLQLPLTFLFGWFVDVSLSIFNNYTPTNYFCQWLLCGGSFFVIALGIFLQVKSRTIYLPGEGLVMAISRTFGKDFGRTKMVFDTTMVVVAVISSLVFLKSVVGVREGTVAAAIFVGLIVGFYSKKITIIDKLLSEKQPEMITAPYMTTDNFVITIEREYGSGGHAIGEAIAKKLNVPFYDSALIDITAEASGLTKKYVKEHEQKVSKGLFYQLYKQNYAYINEAIPPQELIFMVQTQVIRAIAAKESCVIVGRVADYILKGHPNLYTVFIHADRAFRINRVITDYGIEPDDAERMMERKDKERISYVKHYTSHQWADKRNYDSMVNSSTYGIDFTAAIILDNRRKHLFSKEIE